MSWCFSLSSVSLHIFQFDHFQLFLTPKRELSWKPFKVFIQGLYLHTITCPKQSVCAFLDLFGRRIHGPVKNTTRVECGHLYNADWSTKKHVREVILVLSEGFVALKGCSDVLWHLGSCMVLLTALHGHSQHHTLQSKTKTYLSLTYA